MLALAELNALIQALREGGVRRYRDGSVELELHIAGERGSLGAHNPEASGATPEPATEPEQSDMDVLFRSAGGMSPRLRERIAAVKQEPES